MKCGTSTLHWQLDTHPEICMSQPKETNYFVGNEAWERGIEWYRGCFTSGATTRAIGETSINYTKRHRLPGVPERAAGVVPDAKLIFIGRDPIERMESHYRHYVALNGPDVFDIEEMPEGAERNGLDIGRYGFQLEAWLAVYPRDRLLVLRTEDFRTDPDAVLTSIERFIGVTTGQAQRDFRPRRVSSPPRSRGREIAHKAMMKLRGTPTVSPARLTQEQRRRYAQIFLEDAEVLKRLLGPEAPSWNLEEVAHG